MASAMPARNEEEPPTEVQVSPEAKPWDFYDAVIDVQQVRDVFTSGWPVLCEDDDTLKTLTGKHNTTVVSVVGNFGVGKSFILQRLSGMEMLVGDLVHTRGLSIKMGKLLQGKTVHYIDTQGTNSPVLDLGGKDAHPVGEEGLENLLHEGKGREEFLRHIALKLADVFIFVVGQMSQKDQIDLYGLTQAIMEAKKANCTIYVVHNLRNFTRAVLVETEYIDRVARTYSGLKKNNLRDSNDREYVTLEGHKVSRDSEVKFVHHFLTQEGAPGCQNAAVFDSLRNKLDTVACDRILADDFKKCARLALHHFVNIEGNTAGDFTVDFDPATVDDTFDVRRGFRVSGFEDKNIETKRRALGSFVNLHNDDGIRHNISEVMCPIKDSEMWKKIFLVSFEAPGAILKQGSDPAPVRVVKQGRGVRVTLCFDVANIPKELLTKAFASSTKLSEKLSLPPRVSEVPVKDEELRVLKEGEHKRSINFSLDLPIDWAFGEWMWEFNDGVLVVGLVENNEYERPAISEPSALLEAQKTDYAQ